MKLRTELAAAAILALAAFLSFEALRLGRAHHDPVGHEASDERAEKQPAGALPHQWTSVDSARPAAAELERFRASLGGAAPGRLDGGGRSLADLVHRFARALERQDTDALERLALNAAEFAWFYYPYTIYTHEPYEQSPQLVWLFTSENSRKGLQRLLARRAREPLAHRGVRCARTEPQDINLLHLECGLFLGSDSSPTRLFGTVIERQGRFKFVSYANDL